YCNLITGTTAASWQQQFSGSTNRVGTGALVYSNQPALSVPSYSVNAGLTAGTNAQGQGQTTTDVTVVTTTAASPSGVTLLSAGTASKHQTVINKGTNPVNIYPQTGSQIDGLGTNMPYLLPVNGVMAFNSTSSTQWYSEFDAFVLKGVNNATTTVLTSAQLTTAYPNATQGFRVYCTSIIAGSMVYEKTPTQWIGSTVFTP
ncbi:MAG: hypothetical protein H7221_10415, partial [Flavobacterium sp.]|nr:hypothetical protein [Flavobacterium sp.]